MELIEVKNVTVEKRTHSATQFIEANTQIIELEELKHRSIIPVFAKDNESTISHQEFIEIVQSAATDVFSGYRILQPAIRVSHPIKGRIPEAVGKPVAVLLEHEKTIYYERMAFIIEIPEVKDNVNGNELLLTLGGVRAYNLENLSSRKTEEKFKVFIGFQNKVCTNLCISTDGIKLEIKACTLHELFEEVFRLFSSFDAVNELIRYKDLANYSLTEKQFAQLIGRAKLYPYLKKEFQKEIEPFPLNDSQVSIIARQFFQDENFRCNTSSEVDLWRLHSIFTGANKSSYIDRFADRTVASTSFMEMLLNALKTKSNNWYLN